MTTSPAEIETAADALRDAIDIMPDGPAVPGPYFAQWPTVGRHLIKSWIADVEQAMCWAAEGISEAERNGQSSARQLEEALWRLDAAGDRLVVVLSLALEIQLIKLSKAGDGVVFSPDRRAVLTTLSSLGSSSATRLDSAMRRWYEHPARVFRHEVTHSLSQTTNVRRLLDLDVRYMRGGAESHREARMLYPGDVHLASNDISPDAVWRRVLDRAKAGLKLMLESVAAATDVVRDHAHLAPPTVVYYDLDSSTASLP